MIFDGGTFGAEKKEHQMPVVIKQSFIRIEVDLPWNNSRLSFFLPCHFFLLLQQSIEEYCTYIDPRPIRNKTHPRKFMWRLTSYAKTTRLLLKELTHQNSKQSVRKIYEVMIN